MTMYVRPNTLERDVRYLMDRTQILDCVARHARGCDRHDIDLITSAYHSDGVDEHGHAVNAGVDYGQWANDTHAELKAEGLSGMQLWQAVHKKLGI